MGNLTSEKRKPNLRDFLLFLLFLALLAIPIYFAYTVLQPKVKIFDQPQETEEVEEIKEEEEKEEEEVYDGPPYLEVYETIEGQPAYIAVPAPINPKNPPAIILYSHGSNTEVSFDTDEEFMQDLHTYGVFFTENDYIFAASNQHGANWGNKESIQDNINLIAWINERYDTKDKVNMIGYSMGGLPTMNFASDYPERVNKIALLAPTTRSNEWNADRVARIKDIDIKIWHGTADVNVPYSLSTIFVNTLKNLGKEVELITLEGKTHWDIHTEYMEDILEFFNQE
ncbi:MAG TPA: alpha/beta fold hydrolase [Candidatus Dojkabacteria bacterium]|nr:alpha/beta fold hydrolase [Candidatus Dojkabacteria bacterium]